MTTNPKKTHGSSIGKRGFQPKLTEKERLEIIALYAKGDISQAALAERYGVTQAAISGVLHKSKMKSKAERLKALDLPNLDYSLVTGSDPDIRRTIPARPTREITTAVFQDILVRVADGCSVTNACYLEKVSPGTFQRLISQYPDLKQRLNEARAENAERIRQIAFKSAIDGTGNAGTLLKYLERLDPEVYAPPQTTAAPQTVNHNHTHNVGIGGGFAIWDAPDAQPARIARTTLKALARGQSPQVPVLSAQNDDEIPGDQSSDVIDVEPLTPETE